MLSRLTIGKTAARIAFQLTSNPIPRFSSRTMVTPSMISATKFKLNTGAEIPAIGFGTWQDKSAQADAVYEALKAGYRHIDTARVYGTEAACADGIRRSGVPRKDIFITTKLWNNSHHPDDVEPACDASLKDLDTDHIDLYLMHWPSAAARGDSMFPTDKDGKALLGATNYVDTYKAMEKLVQKGKCKAIGISNFSKAEIEQLLKEAAIVPAVHQIELHPYLAQKSFDEFHRKHNIHVTQYSPFGNQNEIYDAGKGIPRLIDDPVLAEIGKKYDKNGAQVALAWGIAHGRSVIPKSKTPSRIRDNLDINFRLDADAMRKIDGLDKKQRFNDPSTSFGYDFFTDLDGKK